MSGLVELFETWWEYQANRYWNNSYVSPCAVAKSRYNAAHSTRGSVLVNVLLNDQPRVRNNMALTSTSGAADIGSVVLIRARYNR